MLILLTQHSALRKTRNEASLRGWPTKLAYGELKRLAAEQTLARSNQSLTYAHQALGGSLHGFSFS